MVTVSLRLKNIKLLSDGETHRIGKRHAEIIGAAGRDGIGPNRRPLVQGLGEICARQQIKCPAELAGCRELQICVGCSVDRQHRLWRRNNLFRKR